MTNPIDLKNDRYCGPLSDTISSGTPKRANTSFILATHAAVVVLFGVQYLYPSGVVIYDNIIAGIWTNVFESLFRVRVHVKLIYGIYVCDTCSATRRCELVHTPVDVHVTNHDV